MSQHATNGNAEKRKPSSHHIKNPKPYNNKFRLLKREKQQTEGTKDSTGNNECGANNSNANNDSKKNLTKSWNSTFHYVKYVERQTRPQKLFLEPVREIDRLFGVEDKDKLTVPETTVCVWWSNCHWKFLHSILPVEPLPAKDLHMTSFEIHPSCPRIWTQSSGLTSELNTCKILGFPPTKRLV